MAGMLFLTACTHHHSSSYNGIIIPNEDDDLPQTIEISYNSVAGSAGALPLTASSGAEVLSP
jgi:hypothetical protein